MWLCENRLKRKTAHFRLPSASQKCACLSSLIAGLRCTNRASGAQSVRLLGKSIDARNFGYDVTVLPSVRPYSLWGWECSDSLRSLSTCVFETRTATGSELFSLLTCLHTTTFTFPSTFSPLQTIRIKIWEIPLSLLEKCPIPVAVRVSKTRVLKLPN